MNRPPNGGGRYDQKGKEEGSACVAYTGSLGAASAKGAAKGAL
jgi:hypothetical protein